VLETLLVRLTQGPLDAAEAVAFVSDRSAGAMVLFTGAVRDHSDDGDVTGLDYEAWDEGALAGLHEIGREMLERWPVCRAALLHRTGHLEVGEVSVVVCCSAPHRAQAFEACRHGIERIKEAVPIWKKERLTTGESRWVMGS
jgi:molybdopterin synthase catalytic subunit